MRENQALSDLTDSITCISFYGLYWNCSDNVVLFVFYCIV